MCWLGTRIWRRGFQHVARMGDLQPLRGVNTTRTTPCANWKKQSLEDIDLHRNTRAPLLNPLFLFLLITPSSLSFCPGHPDRLPAGSGKTPSGPGSWEREWRWAKRDGRRKRKVSPLPQPSPAKAEGLWSRCSATLTHLGSAQKRQPWKLKKTPRNPRIFYSPYNNIR